MSQELKIKRKNDNKKAVGSIHNCSLLLCLCYCSMKPQHRPTRCSCPASQDRYRRWKNSCGRQTKTGYEVHHETVQSICRLVITGSGLGLQLDCNENFHSENDLQQTHVLLFKTL